MTQHSLLGASSAYRWLACPGSFKLSETAPHRRSSIYAATGSVAHAMIEAACQGKTQQLAPDGLVGSTSVYEGHQITIDQDLIDGVNVMLRYLGDVSAGSDWYKVEFRVNLESYFHTAPPVSVFGTVDAGILTLKSHTLEVVDYKNGAGIPVSPVENPQLLFYAAGVLAEIPPAQRKQVKNIKLTIVQPHAQGREPINSWSIGVLDLLMWVDGVLVPGVMACTQDDVSLVPGSWCRFCPVSHACPALMADAMALAKVEFDDVTLPTDPNELAQALDIAERAALWVERIREFALDQLQQQIPIPGWQLIPTRATRKWLYPEADIGTRLGALGLGMGDIFENRLRSPAQLEKVLTRTRPGRKVWDQVTPLIEARSSGVKLGRDNTTSAQEDFADE